MGNEPSQEAPQPLRPARSVDGTDDGREDGRERPAPARQGAPDVKPTPVRDGVAPAPAGEGETTADPVAESGTLVVGGVSWTVRVRGRGQAGADTGPAPLLVLGFFLAPDADVPEREALVVARTLEELTTRQLEGALDVSRPPPESGARKELFPETATKGRKGER